MQHAQTSRNYTARAANKPSCPVTSGCARTFKTQYFTAKRKHYKCGYTVTGSRDCCVTVVMALQNRETCTETQSESWHFDHWSQIGRSVARSPPSAYQQRCRQTCKQWASDTTNAKTRDAARAPARKAHWGWWLIYVAWAEWMRWCRRTGHAGDGNDQSVWLAAWREPLPLRLLAHRWLHTCGPQSENRELAPELQVAEIRFVHDHRWGNNRARYSSGKKNQNAQSWEKVAKAVTTPDDSVRSRSCWIKAFVLGFYSCMCQMRKSCFARCAAPLWRRILLLSRDKQIQP